MENLAWGLQMTVLGMGLVFALLALLWGLLMLVLVLDKEEQGEVSESEKIEEAEHIAAVADEAIGAQVPDVHTVHGMPADLVAAIVVATMKHKLTLRRQAAPFMRSYWPGSQLFASRWVAAGRTRQNNFWQARGK
jgi:hypothetical protein